MLFLSLKHKSVTFPHEFIFMFVPYFIETISSKIVAKSRELGRKSEKVAHIGKYFLEKGSLNLLTRD